MKTVAIIGLGTIGSAIASTMPNDINQIRIQSSEEDLSKLKTVDIIVIAVKPQDFPTLAQNLKDVIKSQLIVSIMAGVSIDSISRQLDTDTSNILRTMPNIGIKSKNSVTAAFSSTNEKLDLAQNIIESWGSVLWLENEDQFDAFTAIAGSGPAYFFELASALKDFANSEGFNDQAAEQLAIQTLKSAGTVIDDSPEIWVSRVASKGGTTEAALQELNQAGFKSIISKAAKAAKERSKELSND